jgi:inosine-uridine nucleoside N-ribohydrolase
MQRIPVILDTDIGTDIDDTWALALLLKSPEVDLKLAVSTTGDTVYRARLLAKLFEAAGRVDIPVGVGLPLDDASREVCPQAGWLGDYDLARYPGKVHADGVGALIETIMMSPEPVTLLGIGPLPNIAAAT